MRVTRRSRLQVRIQNWLFVVLFIAVLGMLAFLSTRFSFDADWTAGQRNTLTAESRQLVSAIERPVRLTAFVRGGEMQRRPFEDLVAKYRRHTDQIELAFVNPDLEPNRAREAGITSDGEVVVEYEGRSERLSDLGERTLSAALQRLTRATERWVAFAEGHAERNPHGEANHDYGLFTAELRRQGIRVRTVNPLAREGIPANTALLIVAGPQVDLIDGAVDALVAFVERGGNLLWLGDPGPLHGLEPLAEHLGVAFADGTVLDATAQMFGVGDPRMVIVAEYGEHAITRDFSVITLFPHVTAVDYHDVPDTWSVAALLTTMPHSTLDTGDPETSRNGPLDIGVALERTHDGVAQRIAVIGDGDFIANAYLGNAGNLDFGLNLLNWLVHDDTQINVHLRAAPDLVLNLPRTAFITISVAFLVGLPLLLVVAGVWIWLRRRRK